MSCHCMAYNKSAAFSINTARFCFIKPLHPSAKTSEARKKNRRTEIILTPKLDELLKVLGNN